MNRAENLARMILEKIDLETRIEEESKLLAKELAPCNHRSVEIDGKMGMLIQTDPDYFVFVWK